MLLISFTRRTFSRALLSSSAIFLALASSTARAQSVPVPFAGTFAGGGTACTTTDIPVFAVGKTGANVGDGCPATQATLNTPVAVATDNNGNVFIADQTNQLVRVVYNGGAALAAAIIASNVQATGLVPVKGNIYTIAGGVTTTPSETTKYCNEAGSGTIGTDTSLDGCPGVESEQGPRGLAVDADGNVFISSVSPDSQVRVFYVGGTAVAKLIALESATTANPPGITNPQPGYVYNIAGGNPSTYSGDGALATKASLNTPRGIFVDTNENVFFTDQLNNVVRRVDGTTGLISTVAGHYVASGANCTVTGTSGDGNAATSSAVNIYSPYAVAEDQYGNLFIAEGSSSSCGGRVRVVYAGGTLPGITNPTPGDIYTFAGGASGSTPAQLAAFQFVYGVSIDPEGYLYVTDYRSGTTGSNKIWRIDPTNGNIAVIAGSGGSALTSGAHCNGGSTGPTATDTRGDGCPATQAYLNTPQETLGFDARGNFYVADRTNNVVRSFTYDNAFAATQVGSSVTQPIAFLLSASTPATEAFTVQGAASTDYADGGGDTCSLGTVLSTATTCVVYVRFSPIAAGQRPGAINIASATATVATQTLNGVGSAPVLTLSLPTTVALGAAIQPLGVSADQLGNVNISDGTGKQVLRTTIAGGAPTAYIASLGTPRQTATDPYGNVFVVDSTNNNVVERTASGSQATFGVNLTAPQGVAADQFGNVYVADTGNNRLVSITPLTGNQRVVPTSGYTLNAPTYLAADPSGDLFVLDSANTRLLEIPLNAGPQLISLPTGAVPTAIAFDPGGDMYLADKSSGDILFAPAGATTATVLITGLTTPTGVAVGPTGNVFVADSSATSAAGYNFALNATTFANTNIGLTSLPATLTLSSVGNLPATLSTPTYTETGTAAAFPSYGTPTCTAGLVLATAATCTQAFDFSPATPGAQSARAVFSDTAGQTVTANFSAFATNLILTNTTIFLNNTGAVNYGQTAAYTVTLIPKSTGSATPTGTISFVVDGVTKATQSVSTTPYTFTFSIALAIGTHAIAATYSGDSLYAGSNASTSITVGKAATTITASYVQTASGTSLGAIVTPASTGALTFTGNVLFYVDNLLAATVPVGSGIVSTTVLVADGAHTYYAMYAGDTNYAGSSSTPQTLTVARAPSSITLTSTPVSTNGVGGLLLSAKVTTASTGTPTGSVTFSNGTTVLGVVTLSATDTATFTTATTSYASYGFTAAYSGDGLFDPSTVTITQGPDFVVTAPTAALAVPQGGQAIESVTVTPINGYSGTLTASCSNLPVNAICTFMPVPVTLTGTAPVTLAVQVFTGVNPNVAKLSSPAFGWTSHSLLALLLMTPLGLRLRRRRAHEAGNKLKLPQLLVLALLLLAAGLTGCGLKTPADSLATYITPMGTSAVTITLTDTNHLSRSTVFNVSVNSQ